MTKKHFLFSLFVLWLGDAEQAGKPILRPSLKKENGKKLFYRLINNKKRTNTILNT